MLKNKKCQALLIAASAFIGINGNVYGSNLGDQVVCGDDSDSAAHKVMNYDDFNDMFIELQQKFNSKKHTYSGTLNHPAVQEYLSKVQNLSEVIRNELKEMKEHEDFVRKATPYIEKMNTRYDEASRNPVFIARGFTDITLEENALYEKYNNQLPTVTRKLISNEKQLSLLFNDFRVLIANYNPLGTLYAEMKKSK